MIETTREVYERVCWRSDHAVIQALLDHGKVQDAAVDRLTEAKNATYTAADMMESERDHARAALAEAQAQNKALREAVEKFGAHKPDCFERMVDWGAPCRCGYADALAALTTEPKGES